MSSSFAGERHFVVDSAKGLRTHASLMKYLRDSRFTNRSGSGASSAARKAMTQIHRASRRRVKSAIITVRETTRGSLGKLFKYRARVVQSNRVMKVGRKKISFKYEVRVRAV